MEYQAKDLSRFLGAEGFSDALLQNHFKLYEGYVANTNKAAQLLATIEKGSYEYAEVKRRFGWEFNGMRLHEYYFENLAKEPAVLDLSGVLAKKIERDFGSYAAWEEDFKKTGAMRGIGWVILYGDPQG